MYYIHRFLLMAKIQWNQDFNYQDQDLNYYIIFKYFIITLLPLDIKTSS